MSTLGKDFGEMLDELSHQITGFPIEDCRARRLLQAQAKKAVRAALADGPKWKVQVHGRAGAQSFEISVINSHEIDYAQMHYGWFDANKLLISHNGGPCQWPLIPLVWDKMIKLAEEVAQELNNHEP